MSFIKEHFFALNAHIISCHVYSLTSNSVFLTALGLKDVLTSGSRKRFPATGGPRGQRRLQSLNRYRGSSLQSWEQKYYLCAYTRRQTWRTTSVTTRALRCPFEFDWDQNYYRVLTLQTSTDCSYRVFHKHDGQKHEIKQATSQTYAGVRLADDRLRSALADYCTTCTLPPVVARIVDPSVRRGNSIIHAFAVFVLHRLWPLKPEGGPLKDRSACSGWRLLFRFLAD